MINNIKFHSNYKNKLFKVFVFSFIVALFLNIITPIIYLGDSNSYLEYANKFVEKNKGNEFNAYYRTSGYPLLLLLTGVVLFKSFIGIIVLQFLMAVFIPILIYKILFFFNEKLAYYSALLSIITLIPYGFMKVILTEQSYIFLLLILVLCTANYIYKKKVKYIYIALIINSLFLLRANSMALFFIFGIMFFIYSFKINKSAVFHSLLSIFIGVLILFSWAAAEKFIINNPKDNRNLSNTSSTLGKMLFYNVYLSQADSPDEELIINESYGNASKKLINVLTHDFADNHDNFIHEINRVQHINSVNFFYNQYINHPQQLIDQIVRSPSRSYYWTLWHVLDKILGPKEANSLLLSVSIEIIKKKPSVFFKYLFRNLYFYALGYNATYTYSKDKRARYGKSRPTLDGLFLYTPSPATTVDLSDQMYKELKFRFLNKKGIDINNYFHKKIWSYFFLFFRPLIFIFMIIGFILNLRSRHFVFFLIVLITIFFHIFIVCALNTPLTRYILHVFLLEYIMAAAGAYYLFKRIRIMNKGHSMKEKHI